MSWNVLITARTLDEVGQTAVKLLCEAGCRLVIPPKYGPLSVEELLPQLEGNEAVLASMDRFTESVLNSPEAKSLKLISRWGVGYDAIDILAATRAGVVVAYAPGFLNEAVADYAFALLLGIARRIHEGFVSMREGRWASAWGHDVHGKVLGILGCGRIGQAMARRAAGFGMQLIGCDPLASKEAEKLGLKYVSFDQLLAESDFLSLHAALTPENRGLIGEAELKSMKPTAYLINTARGALVDEEALAKALREGWIAGAAVDAFLVEPLPSDHPLRNTPNLLLTPHQASFARETGERVSMAAARAIVDLQAGHKPQFVVNPNVYQSPALRAQLQA